MSNIESRAYTDFAASMIERTNFPLCGSSERAVHRAFRDIPVVRCCPCGFLFSSRVLSEAATRVYYEGNFGSQRHLEGQRVNARANATIYETSLSSVNPEVAGKQLHRSKGQLEPFTVPCMTLNDLLERHGMNSFDILQIDVEGHQFKILRTFELSRFAPVLIPFECDHPSPAEIDRTVQY